MGIVKEENAWERHINETIAKLEKHNTDHLLGPPLMAKYALQMCDQIVVSKETVERLRAALADYKFRTGAAL